jgi:hypothetical protein
LCGFGGVLSMRRRMSSPVSRGAGCSGARTFERLAIGPFRSFEQNMPSQKEVDAVKLYYNIMVEIKLRIAAVNAGTMLQLTPPLASAFVSEFCFLQIRIICELVALGCLTAHGDVGLTKRLKKEWDASKIMHALETLHPDFFPQALNEAVPAGEKALYTHNDARQMSKADLLALYRECGRMLHRGSVNKLLKANMPVQVHYPDISARLQKIANLLSLHTVAMLGGRKRYVCFLNAADRNGEVYVFRAVLIEPHPPSG